MKNNRIDKRGLNDRQRMFCQYYVIDLNITEAYKLAYSCTKDSTASVNGSRLLSNANVKAYVSELQGDIEKTVGLTKIKTVKEQMKLAFSNIAKLHNTWITRKKFEELTDDEKACIQEITTKTEYSVSKKGSDEIVETLFVKIKLYDKQKALDSLSKMMGYDAPVKINIGESTKSFEDFLSNINAVKDGFNGEISE